MDNVTVQLHFVRLAFSIAGDVVMEDFSTHMSIVICPTSDTPGKQGIHQSTTCLLEISRGWLLFEGGYAGDFFPPLKKIEDLLQMDSL